MPFRVWLLMYWYWVGACNALIWIWMRDEMRTTHIDVL